MEFFNRLRQLSSTVERDVADIQRSFNSPPSDDDSSDGAALLLLQDIKNDLKKVKTSTQQAYKSLCEGADFGEIVNAAAALVEKENGLLAETEEYLRQYGYTPMATSLVESEVGGGDANGVSEPDTRGQETEERSPEKCTSQTTALTSGGSPVAPTLQSVVLYERNFLTKFKSSNNMATPRTQTAGFSETGIISCDSPIPPVMQTPGVAQFTKVDRTCENNNQVGLVDALNTCPLTPVMQTPGLKQLNRFVVDKQGERVALPAGPGLTTHNDRGDTPELPEVAEDAGSKDAALPPKPTLSSNHHQVDIPEPPAMTFNYTDYVKLMTSRQPPSRTATISRESATPIATVAPHTTGAGISLAAQYNNAMLAEEEMVATPRREEPGLNGGFGTFTRVEDDDDYLPEPPEMTLKLQDLIDLKIRAPGGTRGTAASTTNAPLGPAAAPPCGQPMMSRIPMKSAFSR